MSDTLMSLQRRKQSAADLASVVRTMKAMATANIGQYEIAVQSLQEYYRTILLGIHVCFKRKNILLISDEGNGHDRTTVVVIFGSDQGMVGRFNETIITFAQQTIKNLPGQVETWAVGQRAHSLFEDLGLPPTQRFDVPNAVSAITPLVNQILTKSEEYRQKRRFHSFYIFHNNPLTDKGYQPESRQLFPPDEKWNQEITKMSWPSKNLPQVTGRTEGTLRSLIREYLFVSVYKACAESLVTENISRLEAMQRAEKNIEAMLDELGLVYNRLRQSTIDDELFDIISGFEALKGGF
jgi:F-type H+-transporting ATPase subunit gamma